MRLTDEQSLKVEYNKGLEEGKKQEISQNCPLCSGSGEIISRKARQMGYTLTSGETIDEEIIPCPLCKRVQALKGE